MHVLYTEMYMTRATKGQGIATLKSVPGRSKKIMRTLHKIN